MSEEQNKIQGWNYEQDEICGTHHFIKLFQNNNLKPTSLQKPTIQQNKQSFVQQMRKTKDFRYSDILAYRRIVSEEDKRREYEQKSVMLAENQQINSQNKACVQHNGREQVFKNYGNVAKIEHKKQKIEMKSSKYFYYRKENNQIRHKTDREIANVTSRNSQVMKRKYHKNSFSSFPVKPRLATFDEYGSKQEQGKGVACKRLSKDKINHRKCLSQDLMLTPMEMFLNKFAEGHLTYENSEQVLRTKTKINRNQKPFLMMK